MFPPDNSTLGALLCGAFKIGLVFTSMMFALYGFIAYIANGCHFRSDYPVDEFSACLQGTLKYNAPWFSFVHKEGTVSMLLFTLLPSVPPLN